MLILCFFPSENYILSPNQKCPALLCTLKNMWDYSVSAKVMLGIETKVHEFKVMR